jgi:hypothetical protein
MMPLPNQLPGGSSLVPLAWVDNGQGFVVGNIDAAARTSSGVHYRSGLAI